MGETEKLDLLLKAKMNVNLETEIGVTPLFEATFSLSEECVRRLMAAKADVKHEMHTARWPDWKESMCICSFAHMHAPKELGFFKMMRNTFRFDWMHSYRTNKGWCLQVLYPDTLLSGKGFGEDDLSDYKWCWDNGMPMNMMYARGRGFPTNPDYGKELTAVWDFQADLNLPINGTEGVKDHLMLKLWDLKFNPIDPYNFNMGGYLPGLSWMRICAEQCGLDLFKHFIRQWNDYQVLLAARGDD